MQVKRRNMKIILGKSEACLIDPPNNGEVIEHPSNPFSNPPIASRHWKIGRNGSGLIVLRDNSETHPQFMAGMDLRSFCEWINAHL
jgi:hypothetical protein